MSAAIDINELVAKCRRRAIAMARKAGIDVDDGLQTLALAACEAVQRYDFEHAKRASPETFALALYQGKLARLRAQERFGVELDAEDTTETAYGDDTEDDGEVAPWRSATDADIARRVACLPADLRAFAQRVLAGDDTAGAAEAQGMSDRNGRYMLTKITAFMRACPTAEQGDLFA